jgi:hypothetical protein
MYMDAIRYNTKQGHEIEFDGEWYVVRQKPSVVFGLSTKPCFETSWRVSERAYISERKAEIERALIQKCHDASPDTLTATIGKRGDHYWLRLNAQPSGEAGNSETELEMDELWKILLTGWMKAQAVADLATTQENWHECAEFLLSRPQSWPLVDALKADEIMNHAHPGLQMPEDCKRRSKSAAGVMCVTGRFKSAASSLTMKHVSQYG